MLKRSIVWSFLLMAVVASVLAYGAWRQAEAWLHEPIALPEPVEFTVTKGSGMKNIAIALQQKGLTPNADVFRIYARLQKQDKAIKAGEYNFAGSVTADTILAKLVSGDVQTYWVTIPEGLTYKDFINRLMAHPVMQGKPVPDFASWGKGLNYSHPEGLLFPSTYHFQRSDLPEDVVNLAVARQQALLTKLWEGRAGDLPYKTPYEALILASIVEKETAVVSEMPNIAGVFVKRMQIGMRLQTDPTVIYGLGDAFNGNLQRKHMTQKTPYNTYVIPGLPPTPIALAGENALRAVLQPEVDDDIFFVSKGDGTHAFTPSYKTHLENIKRYQLKR